jgi:hypothetical protein
MFIPDPGSKKSHEREGGKKIDFLSLYVATNITKLKLFFELVKKKI